MNTNEYGKKNCINITTHPDHGEFVDIINFFFFAAFHTSLHIEKVNEKQSFVCHFGVKIYLMKNLSKCHKSQPESIVPTV